MPVYKFHVIDGVSRPDRDGTELQSLSQAKLEAVKFAGGLMRDDPQIFLTGEDWEIEVTDESGLHLFSYTFFATEAPALAGKSRI